MYSGTLESQLGHAAQQQQQHQHHGDFVMQKYLLLQNQHDELQQHMHELCPLYTTSSSTAVTSPSSSPTRHMLNPRSSNSSISSASSSGSLSPPRTRQHRRRSSIPPSASSSGECGVYAPLAPVLDEEVMHEMAADEQMLCDVNEGIKRALTELLNCDTVRRDRAMRAWVQTRLMDTERELRTGRRRRSNGGSVDY